MTPLRYLLLTLALAISLVGCGRARETAKAAAQADVAVAAAQRTVADPELKAAVAAIPEEQRAAIVAALRKVALLLGSARTSLAPVTAHLAAGEPVDAGMTVDEAVAQPEAFAAMAQVQAGRASVEVEQHAKMRAVVGVLLDFGQALGGSWLSQLLLSLGLGGAGLATIAAGVRKVRSAVQVARAAVAYGVDAGNAETDADLERVKAEHARAQEAAGIRVAVAREVAVAKVKRRPAKTAAG